MSSDVPSGQEDTRGREDFMRRLILQTRVSIDGYVAALDSSHPWNDRHRGGRSLHSLVLDSVRAAGAHLILRITYEDVAAFSFMKRSAIDRPRF
jgi:hypothetical protein